MLMAPLAEGGGVLGLALHHLDEAGIVGAAVEQQLGVRRLDEAGLAVPRLRRLVPPGALLRPLAVGPSVGFGLEADDGDSPPVRGGAARRSEIALGPWLDLLAPPLHLAGEQVGILDLALDDLDEHAVPPL